MYFRYAVSRIARILSFWLAALVVVAVVPRFAFSQDVRILAPIVSPPWLGSFFIEESVGYLRWQLASDKFEVHWAEPSAIVEELHTGSYDLGILPSGIIDISKAGKISQISSMASRDSPRPENAVACTFLVPKDSKAHTLHDLEGFRAGASDANVLGDYLACMAELAFQGFNVNKFFSSIRFYGATNNRRLINALGEEKIDVAMIRSGYIEDLTRASGRNLLEHFRVIAPVHDALVDLHSTRTYPGPTLVAPATTDPQLVHRVLSTLLAKPINAWGQYWTVPADFSSMDSLSRVLKMGPYEYLQNWSVERVWKEFKTEISALAVVICALLLHSWRSQVLVRRTTQALNQVMNERLAVEKENQKKAARIDELQKTAAVGQLSSIFAHEMNAPLGTLRSTVHGMRVAIENSFDLKEDQMRDQLFEFDEKLGGLEQQIERASGIVERARSYARNKYAERKLIKAVELVERVAQDYQQRQDVQCCILIEISGKDKMMRADPLEIELIVLNLVKNAAQAAASNAQSTIQIRAAINRDLFELIVSDNGTELTDELLAQFADRSLKSSKADGLGLGVGIVCSLVERYAGSIAFARSPAGGLEVRVKIPTGVNAQEGFNVKARS